MNRTVEILLLFIILAIAGVTSYVLLKVGLNSYSGKVVAISLVILTLVSHIVFLEEKTREDKIFVYILTVFSVIILIKYIPAIFSIPISVFLILMAFYSVHLEHRLPRFVFIVPLALAMFYMFSFITKPIVITSSTGYAIIKQTIFPATITSISGNTITFSQVAKVESTQEISAIPHNVKVKETLFPMTTDCAYNVNNGMTYCFSMTANVVFPNNVVGYFIKGNIGNITCYIIVYTNHTYQTNCPYIKKVTYIKVQNYGITINNHKATQISLEYSITFNTSGFRKMLDYNIRTLKGYVGFQNRACKVVNKSYIELYGLHVYFSTEGTPFVIKKYQIVVAGKIIYNKTLKHAVHVINDKLNYKILMPVIKGSNAICSNIYLYNANGFFKKLTMCQPLPMWCMDSYYINYVIHVMHTYYTPYIIRAQINITKVKLPYVYIGIKFNKSDFGKKVGLVVYNNKKSSPTLQTRLVGNCKGNTCYEIVKEPLPAVNKSNDIKIELIGGPDSKVVAKTEKMYNPIKNVMKSKNMTTQEKKKKIQQTMSKISQMQKSYKPMYKNVAPTMSQETQNVDTVSKGYKIILGVSLAFMLMLIFML